MENKSIKIDKLIINEDIINCLNIINDNITTEINGRKTISAYLKKDGKPTYNLLKAKAAVERLNVLIEEYCQ